MLKKFKPSLDWLLVFVPVSILLEYWPGLHNDTALFICSGLGIVPLAGIMGRATEATLGAPRPGRRRLAQCHVRERSGINHRLDGAAQRIDRRGQSFDHRLDY